MLVKVSKVFADFINKTAGEKGVKLFAEVQRLTDSVYNICVSWENDSRETDSNKVIYITYPANYYASPRAVTTKELIKIYRRNRVRTIEDMKKAVISEFEI